MSSRPLALRAPPPTEFTIAAPVTRARLYILGLGYYRVRASAAHGAPAALCSTDRRRSAPRGAPTHAPPSHAPHPQATINGVPTDDHALGSFTTFTKRILYDVADVTTSVHAGCNALAVRLGHGWYSQPSVNVGGRMLQVLLSVTTSDGAVTYFASQLASGPPRIGVLGGKEGVVSPLTFIVGPNPVTHDDIYDGEGPGEGARGWPPPRRPSAMTAPLASRARARAGENFDARLVVPGWDACGFKPASGWSPAVAGDASPLTNAALVAHGVPVTVDESFSPVAIVPLDAETFVFDFGQNMAGFSTLAVTGPAGTVVQLAYCEVVHQDGSCWDQYGAGDLMLSNYTLAGTGDVEYYTTHFSYMGFR